MYSTEVQSSIMSDPHLIGGQISGCKRAASYESQVESLELPRAWLNGGFSFWKRDLARGLSFLPIEKDI